MSRKANFLLAFLCTVLLVVLSLTGFTLYNASAPPSIQGKLIQPARTIPDFQLTDHHQQAFTREGLQGQWHLLAYGFSHCHAICPGMLAALSSTLRQVEAGDRFNDVDLLFYSVDPGRDTPKRMAEYLAPFSPRITGLTLSGMSGEAHEPLERALGMVYNIPETDRFGEPYPDDHYPVNHNVEIYLINPNGELQAIFQSEYSEHGMVQYSVDRLLQDYLAVREYLASL